MSRSVRLALVAVLLALTGCYAFRAEAPLLTLAARPDAVAERPGGLGIRDSVRYVIHVSVDGLRPDAVERVSTPAFDRLRTEGAWTHNARTDVDYRITLPNHTAQLTGRPVTGPDGHHWTVNVDPEPGVTLHSNRGAYIPSVFDVVHDHGLETAAYVSKSKFSLYDVSYDDAHGAPDTTDADDGRDKIDRYVFDEDTDALVDRVVADLQDDPAAYTFVHLRDPDSAGHVWSWSVRRGSPYLRAVEHADRLLGRILGAVEADPRLAGHTALIVTADHGGQGRDHSPETRVDYTIPFYVWSPGVRRADLYALNADRRADPGTDNVGFDAAQQPVRNGDAASLALAILGLPEVPGSTIGVEPLRIREPEATRLIEPPPATQRPR